MWRGARQRPQASQYPLRATSRGTPAYEDVPPLPTACRVSSNAGGVGGVRGGVPLGPWCRRPVWEEKGRFWVWEGVVRVWNNPCTGMGGEKIKQKMSNVLPPARGCPLPLQRALESPPLGPKENPDGAFWGLLWPLVPPNQCKSTPKWQQDGWERGREGMERSVQAQMKRQGRGDGETSAGRWGWLNAEGRALLCPWWGESRGTCSPVSLSPQRHPRGRDHVRCRGRPCLTFPRRQLGPGQSVTTRQWHSRALDGLH